MTYRNTLQQGPQKGGARGSFAMSTSTRSRNPSTSSHPSNVSGGPPSEVSFEQTQSGQLPTRLESTRLQHPSPSQQSSQRSETTSSHHSTPSASSTSSLRSTFSELQNSLLPGQQRKSKRPGVKKQRHEWLIKRASI